MNSSFSNQKLHDFVVHIEPTAKLSTDVPHLGYSLIEYALIENHYIANPQSPMPNLIYYSNTDINIYDANTGDRLATQMAKGRYLQTQDTELTAALNKQLDYLEIKLLADDYGGWLWHGDLEKLQLCDRQKYIAQLPPIPNASAISDRLPQVIAYIQQAMSTPNEYLWGGTVAPNYDCSGLMQAAFASVGIIIPRDAYQQEAFGDRLEGGQLPQDLQIGDLIFFGNSTKATHVGIYIGNDQYIHSSGKEHGHNGIAISALQGSDPVSKWYAQQLRGAARIVRSLPPIVPI